MDRNREARRSNMAASNGLSRRRQRSTPLRDSLEEDGQIELQETVRLRDRDRGSKRERDRDLLNRNKRRRGDRDRLVQGTISREEGEETTEESVGDEDDYEIEDVGASRILPLNTTSSSFSALPNHNHHRKSLPPPRIGRPVPAFKVADEMMGVSVPRKARSASGKRSHESWASVTGNGGFGKDQNHRRASTSPASRSVEAVSPSSSNLSVRKKTKPTGPKTRLPKVSKSSSSVQEDIEIEIAEVLYGLMKQSHKENTEKLEPSDTNGIIHDSNSSPASNSAHASILTQNNGSESDLLFGVASKKQKTEADSTQVQNSSIASAVKDGSAGYAKMEASSPKLEKKSGFNGESCEVSHDMGASKASSRSPDLNEQAIKQVDAKAVIEESGTATKEKSMLPKEESITCTKLDVDLQDLIVTRSSSSVSEVETREEKFKIDLMAPPPMASSPEQDGIIDLSSDPKATARDVEVKMENTVMHEERVEKLVKEAAVGDLEHQKIKTIGEKLNHESGNDSSSKLQHKQQPKTAISKVETTVQSSSMPLPIAITGWPTSFPPLGYMPPFQTVVPMDGTTASSTVLQPSNFSLSEPRSKRCATHHYIACNIRLHQQFMKMNHFWPAAASSATLCGAKPNNLSPMPSADNMIIGNPVQGSFPVVNLTTAQDKGQGLANIPVFTRKDRSSEGANVVDTAQKRQLLLQSAQPAPAGTLLHGPAYIFSLSQHQAPVTATADQTWPSKSAASISNASFSGNAITGVATNSPALPPVAAAVSFNYPNLAANEAPYLTILPNNGYPFPISTSVGNPPAFRGGNPQAFPFYNGSFYSSQMLHPSQLPQQQPQPLVQPGHQNASNSSGSSSSHKQPQSQQSRGAQVSSSNFLTPISVQSQQPQKHHVLSHQSRKLETELSGESAPTIPDTRPSHTKKVVLGQNYTVPLQPNFALVPSTTVCGGSSGNHGEKQQQPQAKNKKGGVELVPSQAFAMSFTSFSGNGTASNLNFSSMAQNPGMLQSLPDMTRQGYQVVSAPQATQKKNHQLSEGKTGGNASNPDDGKKTSLGKSSTSIGQTIAFDTSARTLNFVPSPFTGSWPSHSITTTTNAPVAATSPNSQQQQLIQLQKHMLHQQLQHPIGASRSKALTTNGLPSSSIGTGFSNNSPIFCQAQAQSNGTSQNSQWKNSLRTPTSQAPLTSLVASNTTTHKNVSQHHGKAPESHSQISFGGNAKSALAPQGQQIPLSNQSPLLGTGSPPTGGNLRSTSTSAKANSSVPALQSQQSDNSSTGNGQKSSPVCGRNVPSILSTCPSHLSELKY